MRKILITTSSFDLGLPGIAALKQAGYEVVLNPHGRRLTEAEVSALLTPDVAGMIAGVEPLTRAVIERAAGLRVISRCGIGLDNVDLDAARERGIAVHSTPEAPVAAVAELTIALMLDALRGVSVQDRSIRAGGWARPMGRLLGACTVGLIGFGRIGRKVGEYAAGFGAQVIMHDPFASDDTRFRTMDELLVQADVVSLHIPYTKDNHHLIDADALVRMKKGAVLVNTGRGGLVDESALAAALKSGHLAAAALDVFEDEPYKGQLTMVESVVLTSHTGSYAREARERQEAEAARNLLAGLTADTERTGTGTHG